MNYFFMKKIGQTYKMDHQTKEIKTKNVQVKEKLLFRKK